MPATQASPAPKGSPVCTRLEGQLATFDRGSNDPARAEQIRKYEEAASKQQGELDRMVSQSRRLQCEGGGLGARSARILLVKSKYARSFYRR